MKCNEAQGHVAYSLDEALSAKDQAQVDTHLAECPPCVGWLTQMVVLREVLRGMKKIEDAELPPPVPEHLVRRILDSHKAAVEQHKKARKSG
jgi:predicted anti-sigma-YlaC factor YlaD